VKLSHAAHTRRSRTAIALASAGLLAVLLGAIAYASTTSTGASRAAAATTPNQLPAIIDRFALLRTPASGPPPAELGSALAKAPASYGLRLAAARHSSNTNSWLVPGDGWLCIAARDADGLGMSCTSAASAEAGELTLIERSQSTGQERVVGACPDGYSTISAFGAEATTQLASSTVRENTYTLSVRGARRIAIG
jgi:hypothetical protein